MQKDFGHCEICGHREAGTGIDTVPHLRQGFISPFRLCPPVADLPVLVAAVGVLAAVHSTADRLVFLDAIPRSRWLSIAGGVPVANVFVRLLPELAAEQSVVSRSVPPALPLLEKHVYLIALVGLPIFDGPKRVVRVS